MNYNKLITNIKRFKTKCAFIIVLSKDFYFKNENEMIKLIRENKDIDFLITDFDLEENEVIFIERGQFYSDNIIWKCKESN